jgi:MFS family permease
MRSFYTLWIGQSISMVGSEVTVIALPLAAVYVLNATPFEMGLLTAAEYLPFLLFALLAGVWVDRQARRPTMIFADIGRAIVLGTVPAAALLGVLAMQQLYVAAFAAGFLTLLFDIAYYSYLPLIVSDDQLVKANSRLELSRSGAQLVGPGLAGFLVQLATAPIAIAVDAFSFIVSAASVALVPREATRPTRNEKRGVVHEIAAGLRMVATNRTMRGVIACAVTLNFFGSVKTSAYVLYAIRDLGLSPAAYGLVWTLGNLGFIVGALGVARIGAWAGIGRAATAGALLIAIGWLVTTLAPSGNWAVAFLVLVAAHLLFGFANPLYNVSAATMMQTMTPDQLRGRVSATSRFLIGGAMPIGALAGGGIAEVAGPRFAVGIAAAGMLLAFVWLLASAVPTVRYRPSAEATR